MPAYYALVALFFALFSLFRYSVSLGLIERPLVVGLAWGFLTGQWEIAVSIAVFFELAWLDLIPAGTFIPPHLVAATTAALALATGFELMVPGEILVAMLASIPLAWLGTRLEALLRQYNIKAYNESLEWVRSSRQTPFPAWITTRSVLVSLTASGAGFFACILLLHALVALTLPNIGQILARMNVTWPHLWLGASLGGLLALRVQRAYAVFASGAAIVFLLGATSIF